MTDLVIGSACVQSTLARHLDFYRNRSPDYQTAMLNSLRALWRGRDDDVLDIGGGTGVIGQCIADLFPVASVTAVDVVDRFCSTLTIERRVFDGTTLPFEDGTFSAATFNNVIHHVPVAGRERLLHEVARVVAGPVYIKDHVAGSRLDHLRLAALDLLGNLPFGGMIQAAYLEETDWQALAAGAGYRIAATRHATYRTGAMAALFPNRLEIAMRWERG